MKKKLLLLLLVAGHWSLITLFAATEDFKLDTKTHKPINPVLDLSSVTLTLVPAQIPALDWSKIASGKPTTIAGYGITDFNSLGDVRWPQLSGSYANPPWITSLPFSKLTATPTTLAGYGITDNSFANLLSKPTTLAGYGITDLVALTNVANSFTPVQAFNSIASSSLTTSRLANPSAPTVIPVGANGLTTWSYKIVAKLSDGAPSAASPAGSTAIGDDVLDSINKTSLTWPAVPGAASYDVYRVAHGVSPSTNGKIANVSTNSYLDTGAPGDSSTPPATNFTGRVLAYSVVSNINGRFNVKAPPFNAAADDATDDTAAFQAAIDAANAVGGGLIEVPAGTYYIAGQINLFSNIVIEGAGQGLTIIHVKTITPANATFFSNDLDVRQLTIRNLTIQFDQPNTSDINALVQYKPALMLTPQSLIENVTIAAAWDGIDFAHYFGSQSTVKNCRIGALHTAIKIDNSSDTFRIDAVQFSSFGMSDLLQDLYFHSPDETTAAKTRIAIDVYRCDGLQINKALFINGGISIWIHTSPTPIPNVEVTTSEFDGPARIQIDGGSLMLSSSLIYGGGTPKVIVAAGSFTASGNVFIMYGAGESVYYNVSIAGGTAVITGNYIAYLDNGSVDQVCFGISSGNLTLGSNHFERGPTGTHTFNRPSIAAPGGVRTFTGNTSSALVAGTGTFISVTSPTLGDTIENNNAPGWTVDPGGLEFDGGIIGTKSQPLGNTNNFSGLVLISDTNWTASSGLFLLGAGGIIKLGDTNSAYTTAMGTALKINVYQNAGGALEVENNTHDHIIFRLRKVAQTKNSL